MWNRYDHMCVRNACNECLHFLLPWWLRWSVVDAGVNSSDARMWNEYFSQGAD